MKHFSNYFKLILGSAIYSVGFSFLLYPAKLVSGGITGISMIISLLTGVIPVGVQVIIYNVPIFIIGFKRLGLKFMADSLIGMVLTSVFIDLLQPHAFVLTADPLLSAVMGGVIDGIGIGIVFSVGATTGGTDIVARFVRRSRPDFNIGQIQVALNIAVVVAYVVSFGDYERAMYSVIAMFASSYVIDTVLYGFNYGKLVYIISDRYDLIGKKITEQLERGVTILHGAGAYSGVEKTILMVAIKRRQIIDIRKIVAKIDPMAFVIVTETKEVIGLGFEKITN
ncbi:MAG: YitT family protein [Oscillospiraceae bacterium]|jgi:uncharacterized membrane-anchored protein YitT (DUF2179 family)|nr:YitT family protein [Oscillospiraceae bacterium]